MEEITVKHNGASGRHHMIAIVDYGMGNLRSVANAIERLGYDAMVTGHPTELMRAERLILPGVGAFADSMRMLRERGLVDALNDFVHVQKKPVLGICLGMQLMAERSYEHGETAGLGWIAGDVVRIDPPANGRIPHMGWNTLTLDSPSPLTSGLPDEAAVYFVHSYWMRCADKADIAATTEYGQPLTAAISRGNIWGTQFHPEKSQETGQKILDNFLRWSGRSC